MVIVGLTGSIGMGKSTAAKMLREMGVPVYDADAAVHELQAPGGAALPGIEVAFPGVVKAGVLDRQALGARVYPASEKEIGWKPWLLSRVGHASPVKSLSMPAMIFISVDLPVPFGPTIPILASG